MLATAKINVERGTGHGQFRRVIVSSNSPCKNRVLWPRVLIAAASDVVFDLPGIGLVKAQPLSSSLYRIDLSEHCKHLPLL